MMSSESLLFQHPCNIFISGPSGSGKTEFVKKMIDSKLDLFHPVPQKIVWCYKEWQKTYTLLQESEDIKFIEGIPNDEFDIVSDVTIPHLVVFDDMLGEKDVETIKLWFTRKSHHRNATAVYITQSLFEQSKASRTISLNAHYMVLFKNTRDKGQIRVLGTQTQLPQLIPAYQDATSVNHGYLLIDFHPRTPDVLRLRTDIFHPWVTQNERGPTVYV